MSKRVQPPAEGRPAADWTDAELIDAMRRSVRGAFREFFERFVPLMTAIARGSRGVPEHRMEGVIEFLDDAALRLTSTMVVPRSLAAYLATSFRHRLRNGVRDRQCRERLRAAYATDAGSPSEQVIDTACSEDAVRATHEPGWERAPLPPAIERFALELERGLSPDESQLLVLLANRVPQRVIASWMGTTHGALRVRVTRLRTRLLDEAMRYAWALDGPDRLVLDRFFRRAGIALPRLGAQASPSKAAISNDGAD